MTRPSIHPPSTRRLRAAGVATLAVALAVLAPAAQDAPAPDPHARELAGVEAQALVIDPMDGRLIALTDARRPFAESAPAQTLAQLVTAFAALGDPAYDARATFRCGAVCGSAAQGHGTVALEGALALGCERFFKSAAPRVGFDRFRRAAFDLGLGPSPAVDYVNGVAVVPAATTSGALPELMATGFGMALTPARAAAMIAIVAADTTRDQAALAALRRALTDSIARGEAAEAWREAGGPPAAGKVGTGAGGPSWFLGFAPPDRPRVAVVVLANGSGADAIRAGARLLSRYGEPSTGRP